MNIRLRILITTLALLASRSALPQQTGELPVVPTFTYEIARATGPIR